MNNIEQQIKQLQQDNKKNQQLILLLQQQIKQIKHSIDSLRK